jgi:hypothetical protein
VGVEGIVAEKCKGIMKGVLGKWEPESGIRDREKAVLGAACIQIVFRGLIELSSAASQPSAS